ncbi:hypothetical protein OFB63_32580, partial [Escherichia coli]|nr:hypothetical protein [Escherichia coli]
ADFASIGITYQLKSVESCTRREESLMILGFLFFSGITIRNFSAWTEKVYNEIEGPERPFID